MFLLFLLHFFAYWLENPYLFNLSRDYCSIVVLCLINWFLPFFCHVALAPISTEFFCCFNQRVAFTYQDLGPCFYLFDYFVFLKASTFPYFSFFSNAKVICFKLIGSVSFSYATDGEESSYSKLVCPQPV